MTYALRILSGASAALALMPFISFSRHEQFIKDFRLLVFSSASLR
jgi:hypothetical protein